VSPTETDEPFEMLFGLWTRLVSRNHVLGWAQIPPQEKDQFWGFSDPLKCIRVYKQQTLQTYPEGTSHHGESAAPEWTYTRRGDDKYRNDAACRRSGLTTC